MTLTLIELVQTSTATWDVILGEGDHRLDISDAVEHLRLSIDARKRIPQVVLELTAYPKFHLNAEVVVDELTAECLKMLGWTPPVEETPDGTHHQARVVDLPSS